MAFLNFRAGATRKEKPAVAAAGFPPRKGHVQPKQDEPNMQNKLFKLNVRDPQFTETGTPLATVDQVLSWIERGRYEVFSVAIAVSPDVAEELLRRNPDNRPLRLRGVDRSVEAYAAAMQRGEWVLNGEHVIVSQDGLLNDGQHRLAAVIKSGETVPMMLTFGVDRGTRHTVDQGAARTLGHVLAMLHYKNSNALATAVGFLWCVERDLPFWNRPSNDEAIATVEAHPGLAQAVTESGLVARSFRVSVGCVAVAYYLCSRHNPGVAADVLRKTYTGIGIISEREPVNKLRKRYTDHLSKVNKISGPEAAALFVKAFNATLRGRQIQALMWRQEGPAAEEFPAVGA